MDKELMKLAKKGDYVAQCRLGCQLCAENNRASFAQGERWLRHAAKKNMQALHLLGRMYTGYQKNFKACIPLYQACAQDGQGQAAADLGDVYQFHLIDLEAARHWYATAAQLGHAAGTYKLACLYHMGGGGAVNFAAARQCFAQAAALGHAMACFDMGLLHLRGEGVKANVVVAADWFEKATKLGVIKAFRAMGELYYPDRQLLNDAEKSFYWYSRGSALGDSTCQLMAGHMLYDGIGCDMDYAQALAQFMLAGNQKEALACMEIGGMLLRGEGCKVNKAEACKWLQRAVALGNEEAGVLLAKLPQQRLPRERPVPGATREMETHMDVFMAESTYTGMEAERQRERAVQAKRRELLQVAQAATPGKSYVDAEFGVVFSESGDIAYYIDSDLDIAVGAQGQGSVHYDAQNQTGYSTADGSVFYHDSKNERTYNAKTGETSVHYGDNTFHY